MDTADYINIAASCGLHCAAKNPDAVPPALVDNEDKYRASLSGCSAGTGNPSFQGEAYLSYNPSLKRLTYTVYHNIPTATNAVIQSSASDQIWSFPVPQSPLRGDIYLSWFDINELWNGNWTISVTSDDSSQSISGSFGCDGLCSTPPSTSAVDPCATIPGEAQVYTDGFNSTIGWIDWSWTVTKNYTYSNDALCGKYSAQIGYGSYGSFSFHAGNGNCTPAGTPLACTAYWEKPFLDISLYTYLQFYVKSPSGPLSSPLYVRAQDQTDTQVGQISIATKYIDNSVIDDNWSRVKIPLADLGFKGIEYIGTFGIFVDWVNSREYVLFDQIKLVPEYLDPLTKPPFGVQQEYSNPYKAFTCDAAPPTATGSSTDSGSASVGGGGSTTGEANSSGGSPPSNVHDSGAAAVYAGKWLFACCVMLLMLLL